MFVNHANQEQTDGATSAQPKAEWTCPELVRLDTGSAEAADITGTDGIATS